MIRLTWKDWIELKLSQEQAIPGSTFETDLLDVRLAIYEVVSVSTDGIVVKQRKR